MATYCDANGRPDPRGSYELVGGKVRPRTLRDGEYAGFNMAFADNGPSSPIFLTDANVTDAAIAATVARERMIHDQRFAFMGDKAPAFDQEKATFLARSDAANASARAVRDAALAARHMPAITDAAIDAARAEMIADLNDRSRDADSAAAVRDMAWRSRYS